jgi:hypothetical protein
MNVSAKGFLSRPSTTHNPRKQTSPMTKTIQQRAKFFELDYLFAEPRIDWFSRASRRKKQHERTKNDSRTMQMSYGEGSPQLGRSRTRTIELKEVQKKAEELTPEGEGALHIGDRGEAIHSMKWDSRIRTISSPNENRISETAFKQELRSRARERIVEGERPGHQIVAKECLMFAVSAQGVNYSERVTTEEKQGNREKHSLSRRKASIAARGKPLKMAEAAIKVKDHVGREGRACRPWSPVHHSGHQVGLDELLTLD